MTPRPESTSTAAAKSPAGALALAFIGKHKASDYDAHMAFMDLRALLAERDAARACLVRVRDFWQGGDAPEALMDEIERLAEGGAK